MVRRYLRLDRLGVGFRWIQAAVDHLKHRVASRSRVYLGEKLELGVMLVVMESVRVQWIMSRLVMERGARDFYRAVMTRVR